MFKIHTKPVLRTLLDYLNMAQRSLRKQTKSEKSKSEDNNTKTREFYLMEKLYDAMRKDKVHNRKLSAN